jgi:hypothetical protein
MRTNNKITNATQTVTTLAEKVSSSLGMIKPLSKGYRENHKRNMFNGRHKGRKKSPAHPPDQTAGITQQIQYLKPPKV